MQQAEMGSHTGKNRLNLSASKSTAGQNVFSTKQHLKMCMKARTPYDVLLIVD